MPIPKHPGLTDPRLVIDRLVKTDEFIDSNKGLGPQLGRKGFELALSDAALCSANKFTEEHGGFATLDVLQERLIGLIPQFIDVQTKLNKVNLHPTQAGALLRQIMPFNHTIGEIIEMAPNVRLSDLMKFIKGAAMNSLADTSGVSVLDRECRIVIHGFRNEINAEKVLWLIDGVEDVQKATVSQELRHIDRVVTYKGEELYLDVKSSEADAAYANRMMRDVNMRAIWSGFTTEDFGDKLSLPDELINREVPYYQDMLDDMLDSVNMRVRAV
ncbi:MAG: hypothetical protein WBB94_00910 [Candidatus Saccharimonadaceae bacterium]